MDRITLNTAITLPVIMKDVNGDPVTGLVFGDVTCKYSKVGAALGTLTVISGNWAELGQGLYTLDFTTSEIDTLGWFTYLVTGTGAKQYNNTVRVMLEGQVFVTGAYHATTTELVIRSWLKIDGQLITTPDSVAISIRDDTEVEQFTYANASASTAGFFTITDTGPGLEDDHNYSVVASIVYGGNTYTTGTTLLTLS